MEWPILLNGGVELVWYYKRAFTEEIFYLYQAFVIESISCHTSYSIFDL
jgi:hypothetical protein